jgi:hypothetical protein
MAQWATFLRNHDELDLSTLTDEQRAVRHAGHAGVESMGANILAGPFAAMLDKARDALSGKHT